ncbi:MAG: outer membrane beta-barrel protein [Rhodospirillaceae bacterium]|nr:outer membrane beta-barrel protein [Rhodospirillaceae bacterium]
MKLLPSLVLAAAGLAAVSGSAGADGPRHVVPAAQSAPASERPPLDPLPGWYQRPGEGAFSFRDPIAGLYFHLGGHAGWGQNTTLRDDRSCNDGSGGVTISFFFGCTNARPRGDLAMGGGFSIGVGTRLTPALRFALTAALDTGYRFYNDAPWYAPGGVAYNERIPVQSGQFAANLYLDFAGLMPPGKFGLWNAYIFGGLGAAVNRARNITETSAFGGTSFTTKYDGTGGQRASFLWQVGAGVQYQIAPGVLLDASYQYVDAGSFLANASGGPITFTFEPIRGHFRTHRAALAVHVSFERLSRIFSGH